MEFCTKCGSRVVKLLSCKLICNKYACAKCDLMWVIYSPKLQANPQIKSYSKYMEEQKYQLRFANRNKTKLRELGLR